MSKLKNSPRRAAGWLWRKLPWHGKIAAFFIVLAMVIYTIGFVGETIGALLGIPI